MRFAEVFLRIGCSLVGWMILIAYVVWLAVAGRIACTDDTVDLYNLLFFAAPIAMFLALMIRATRALPDIHRTMRWIGVFPALFIPNAVLTITAAAKSVFASTTGPCGIGLTEGGFPIWPVIQAISLLGIVALLVINWREAKT